LREHRALHYRWFGKKNGRVLRRAALDQLQRDPLAETKNEKLLRPNRIAQSELRLFGKYRVLFSVDDDRLLITIVLVGEKRGNQLLVAGEEFSEHHESDSVE
jgi:mRNA-degrading endonuclease RelE of RelBE toxin-antitoxin system